MEKIQEAGERRLLDGVEESELKYTFQNKRTCLMVRSLMASRMAMSEPCRKHMGLAHSLEAIMISFSVKFNLTCPSRVTAEVLASPLTVWTMVAGTFSYCPSLPRQLKANLLPC